MYNVNLLVKGKLIVILEKKPSGGYLTKGNESEGVTTIVVPGGSAKRPSWVTQRILFCLVFVSSCDKHGDTMIFSSSRRNLIDVRKFLIPRFCIV